MPDNRSLYFFFFVFIYSCLSLLKRTLTNDPHHVSSTTSHMSTMHKPTFWVYLPKQSGKVGKQQPPHMHKQNMGQQGANSVEGSNVCLFVCWFFSFFPPFHRFSLSLSPFFHPSFPTDILLLHLHLSPPSHRSTCNTITFFIFIQSRDTTMAQEENPCMPPAQNNDGRLGYLTNGQVHKLQQFWIKLYEIFDGKTPFDQSAPSSYKGQAQDNDEDGMSPDGSFISSTENGASKSINGNGAFAILPPSPKSPKSSSGWPSNSSSNVSGASSNKSNRNSKVAPRFTGAQLHRTFWKLAMMEHPDMIMLKVHISFIVVGEDGNWRREKKRDKDCVDTCPCALRVLFVYEPHVSSFRYLSFCLHFLLLSLVPSITQMGHRRCNQNVRDDSQMANR